MGVKNNMKVSTVEAWLNEVVKDESTKAYYRRELQNFLEYCGCSVEGITEQWELADALVEKKLKKKWNRKIKEYKAVLSANPNLVEGTVTTYLCPVLSFFNWVDIPLKIKVKSGIVTYHNRDILREELDLIISNAPHIRDSAFYSMIAQTGLRPVVLSRLQYIDIKEDWENKVIPCKINVPKHKNKGEYKAHYTFMPLESVELLRKYFDSRFGIGKNPDDEDLIFTKGKAGNSPVI